jgi:diamine N-acetyltransferase
MGEMVLLWPSSRSQARKYLIGPEMGNFAALGFSLFTHCLSANSFFGPPMSQPPPLPQLRPVTLADITQLAQVGAEAFAGAFASQNIEADMADYLQKTFTEAQVATELADPANQFYFLISWGEVAGYCKLVFQSPPEEMPEVNWLKISRFYLLPARVGWPGLAQTMMEQVLDLARQADCTGAWLSVWQENHRAIRFYEKNGFSTFGTTQFKLGQSIQQDFMMVKLF